MKLYNVGILGATGAVGQEMMKILLERKFPVGELRLRAQRGQRDRLRRQEVHDRRGVGRRL